MKILLIASCSNDVFIYNFAKSLKVKLPDAVVDVFELDSASSSNQQCDSSYYDKVTTISKSSWVFKIRLIRAVIQQFIYAHQLDNYLRNNEYDVIQVHYVRDYIPLSKELAKHKSKVFLSFWGGELEHEYIFLSHKIYRCLLNRLVNKITGIIGTRDAYLKASFPNTKIFFGSLGSAPVDRIYQLLDNISKTEAKRCLSLPDDKVCVLIGYSGKPIHQHLEIIKKFVEYPELRQSVHLIAPLTRGATPEYAHSVNEALRNSGFSFSTYSGHFFSDDEIALLRLSSDVTFQFSTYDAYSRSIIESLCAGSLLIYGNWIDYEQYLSRDGFAGIRVDSIESGMRILKEYISNASEYEPILAENTKNGNEKFSWSYCINDWINVYKNER